MNDESIQHPATGCMAFLRSMKKKWEGMAGQSSANFEKELDKRRRHYREFGGRPMTITDEQVKKIFDLYWGSNLTQRQVAAECGLNLKMISLVLRRVHPLSKNHPKHKQEKKYENGHQ